MKNRTQTSATPIAANDSQIDGPTIQEVRIRVLPDGRVTRRDAAAYLGLKEKTLAMWVLQNKGPRSRRVGGRAFYFLADLEAFVRGEDRDQDGR